MRPQHRSGIPIRSKLLMAVGVVALVAAAMSFVREYQRRRAVSREIRTIEVAIADMEQRRNRISDLLRTAETPEFLEREARLRLGLQKPGERVLIVPGVGDRAVPEPAPTPESNPRKWWRRMFGR